MKQSDYKFDYKYSGHMTQFVDVLSKIQDEHDMMDRGFEILSKVTRYKFIIFLEKDSNGFRLPEPAQKPRSRGFRSPYSTDVGKDLLELVSDTLINHKRENLVHVNRISSSS